MKVVSKELNELQVAIILDGSDIDSFIKSHLDITDDLMTGELTEKGKQGLGYMSKLIRQLVPSEVQLRHGLLNKQE